jgi:phosphohistidine phosphatase
MKTLYLIRHAKSDWSTEGIPDIDRSLNLRGYASAYKMSALLLEKKIIPDLIVTSPAIRAISTALIFSRTLKTNPTTMLIQKELYGSSVKEYLQTISELDEKHKTVFLFGHNPIITNCVNALSNSFTEEMSTCSVVGLKGNSDWKTFSKDSNDLIFYDFPKNHF